MMHPEKENRITAKLPKVMLFFLLLSTAQPLLSQDSALHTKFITDYPFSTMTTEHFHIHYPADLLSQARFIESICDAVHDTLSASEQWVPDRRTDVILVDTHGGALSRIHEDENRSIYPVFHPDGERILFSSDVPGILNSYALNTVSSAAYRMTDLLRTAFSFDMSPDRRRILLSGYTKDGNDLFTMIAETKPYDSFSAQAEDDPFDVYDRREIPPPPRDEQDSYTLQRQMIPLAASPALYTEEIGDGEYDLYLGASFFASDPLGYHSVVAEGASGTTEEKANVFGSYTYAKMYPDLTFQYQNNQLFWGDDTYPRGTPDVHLQRRLPQRVSGIVTIPSVKYEYASLLSVYYAYETERVTNFNASSGRTDTFTVNNSHAGAAIQFSSLNLTSFTPIAHSGLLFTSSSEYYSEYLGADYTYVSTYGRGVVRTFPLPFRMIASLEGQYGYIHNVDTDVNSFSLGRYKSSGDGSLLFDDQSLGLRGYPAGAHIGSRLAGGSVECTIPVIISDFGFRTWPLYFRSLYMTLFSDAGSVWQDGKEPSLHYSAGVEIDSLLTLRYRYDIRMFIGYAHGFTEYGEDQYYVGIRSLLHNIIGGSIFN